MDLNFRRYISFENLYKCNCIFVSQDKFITSRVKNQYLLTHWVRVTHKCASKQTVIGSYNGFKLLCNLKRNSNIFVYENAFANVVCEMAAVLPRPQCNLSCPGSVVTSTEQGLTTIRTWWINYINNFTLGVITHPYPHFNGGSTRQALMLEYGRIITLQCFTWI